MAFVKSNHRRLALSISFRARLIKGPDRLRYIPISLATSETIFRELGNKQETSLRVIPFLRAWRRKFLISARLLTLFKETDSWSTIFLALWTSEPGTCSSRASWARHCPGSLTSNAAISRRFFSSISVLLGAPTSMQMRPIRCLVKPNSRARDECFSTPRLSFRTNRAFSFTLSRLIVIERPSLALRVDDAPRLTPSFRRTLRRHRKPLPLGIDQE